MFYSVNDTGKSYQACHFPHPFLVMTESGGSALNVPKDTCDSWSKFKSMVDDFVKKTQYTYYTAEALEKVKDDVAYFAESEGLGAHAKSTTIRFEKE